jgi:hypothetical protein
MQQRLNTIAGTHGGQLSGAEFLERQHRLRYSASNGRQSARDMAAILASSPMRTAARVYWRKSIHAAWKQVPI